MVNNFDHLNKKGRLDGDDASNGQNPKKIRHVPTPSNKKQELSTTSRATQTEHWVRMGPNPSDRRQEWWSQSLFRSHTFSISWGRETSGLAGVQPTGNGKSPGNDRCVLLATRKNGGSGEKSKLAENWKVQVSPMAWHALARYLIGIILNQNGCRKRAPRPPVPIPRYPRSRTEISQIWWSDVSKQVSHKPWYLDGETKNIKNLHLSRDIRIYCTQKSPAAPLGPRACWTSLELLLWAR